MYPSGFSLTESGAGVSPAMPPKAAVTGAADAGSAGKAGGTPAPLKISAAFDNIFTRSMQEKGLSLGTLCQEIVPTLPPSTKMVLPVV